MKTVALYLHRLLSISDGRFLLSGIDLEYEHRGMASPAQPQRAGTSYTAWPAFQPITNGAYQSSSVTASYSTERTSQFMFLPPRRFKLTLLAQ